MEKRLRQEHNRWRWYWDVKLRKKDIVTQDDYAWFYYLDEKLHHAI